MNAAYISAVLKHLPGVPLVFDHFHVVKLMNECLTEVRFNRMNLLNGGQSPPDANTQSPGAKQGGRAQSRSQI
jgi:transposase